MTDVTVAAEPEAPSIVRPQLEITETWRGTRRHSAQGRELLGPAGRDHALLGENGAGKSTLVGIAAGSITPDEGTVAIGGETVVNLSPMFALRRGLAIVHQEPALLPDLTVLENMVLAIRASYATGGAWRTNAGRVRNSIGWDATSTSMSASRTLVSRTAS